MNTLLLQTRRTLLFISLCYLTLYLPLAWMIYAPHWYQINCNFHERCQRLGQPHAERAIDELTQYFRHQGVLVTRWTAKEKQHLAEVRRLYDALLLFGFLAVLTLALVAERNRLGSYALLNIVLLLALLAVVPFFKTFWRDIFHPLLFDNQLWKNTQHDVSYYIMPRLLFRNSVILLVVVAVLENLAIWASANLSKPIRLFRL